MSITFNNQNFNVSQEFARDFQIKKDSGNTLTSQEISDLDAIAFKPEEKAFVSTLRNSNIADTPIEPNTFQFTMRTESRADAGQSVNYQEARDAYIGKFNNINAAYEAYKLGDRSVTPAMLRQMVGDLERNEFKNLENSTMTTADRNNFSQQMRPPFRDLKSQILSLPDQSEFVNERISNLSQRIYEFGEKVKEYSAKGYITQSESNELNNISETIRNDINFLENRSLAPSERDMMKGVSRALEIPYNRFIQLDIKENPTSNPSPQNLTTVDPRSSAISVGGRLASDRTSVGVSYSNGDIGVATSISTNGDVNLVVAPNSTNTILGGVTIDATLSQNGEQRVSVGRRIKF